MLASLTSLRIDLFVGPLARSRGLAVQLLAAAVDFARANGAASLSLQTANHNEPARAPYDSQGRDRE